MRLLALTSVLLATASADVITKCVSNGMFAMSFDDGPTLNIPTLLSKLSSRNAKATFHFVTQYLTDPSIQSIVRSVAAAGHIVGLKSETAWNLFTMDSDTITSEIKRVATVMSQFSGSMPKFIRLPYGGFDTRIIAAVEAAGMIITQTNVDLFDYNAPNSVYNATQLAVSLYANGGGNFICAQHDAVIESVNAVPAIIDLLVSKKYKIVRIDECVGTVGSTPNDVKPGSPTTAGNVPTSTGTGNGNGNGGGATDGSTGKTSGAANLNFGIVQLFIGIVAIAFLAL